MSAIQRLMQIGKQARLLKTIVLPLSLMKIRTKLAMVSILVLLFLQNVQRVLILVTTSTSDVSDKETTVDDYTTIPTTTTSGEDEENFEPGGM